MKSIFEGQNNSFNNSFIWGQSPTVQSQRYLSSTKAVSLSMSQELPLKEAGDCHAESCGFRVREWSSIPTSVAESTFEPGWFTSLHGPLFPILWKQKDVLSTCFHGRKKCLKEKEFKWRGEVWAEAKPEDRGPGLTHPCPWHEKSMERT